MTALHCLGERPPAERSPTVRLSFALPPALLLRAEAGRYAPTLHGCRLDVDREGKVIIGGHDGLITHATGQVLEQALRFLFQLTSDLKALPPQTFPAALCAGDRSDEGIMIGLGGRVALARSPINRAPELLVR